MSGREQLGRWTLVLLVVILPIAGYLYGARPTQAAASAGALTYGSIWVDSPEIYTRERLVNDRFRQDEWLRLRLGDTDTVSFGVQGARSTRSTDSTGVSVTVGGDPSAALSPDALKSQLPTTPQTALENASGSPIDHFRDLLAYREEVRNEIIQNQLDDRHDLNGNTLYRCKFDATLMPGPNTQGTAVVEVTIQGAFKRLTAELAPFSSDFVYLPIESGGWLERAKDKLAGPSVPKSFQNAIQNIVTIRAVDGGEAVTQVGVQPNLSRLATLYELWLEHLEKDLQAKVDTLWSTTSVDKELETHISRKLVNYFTDRQIYQEGVPSKSTQDVQESVIAYCTAQDTDPKSDTSKPRIDHYVDLLSSPPESFLTNVGYDTSQYSMTPFSASTLLQAARIEQSLGGVSESLSKYATIYIPDDPNQLVSVEEPKLQIYSYDEPKKVLAQLRPFLDYMGAELGASFASDPFVAVSPLPLVDSPAQDSVPEEQVVGTIDIRTGLQAFVQRLLGSQTIAYSYAVTPKESAQRISSLSEGKDSLQAMLSTGSVAGAVGLNSALSNLSQREELIGAIERQPLVVGYGRGESGGGKSGAGATFGWLLGPRFHVTDQTESGVEFRHAPAQHSLAAIVSAPAWWPEMRVEIEAYWMDAGGKRQGAQSTASGSEPMNFTVSLPGDVRDLDDLLSADRSASKSPQISSDMKPVDVSADSPANILIPGFNLWRSSVVTLGGQVADRIAVLPSMNGIVATFNTVARPTAKGDAEVVELPLTVWTSEGEATVEGKVSVHLIAGSPEGK